jgi:hypothetical protein
MPSLIMNLLSQVIRVLGMVGADCLRPAGARLNPPLSLSAYLRFSSSRDE